MNTTTRGMAMRLLKEKYKTWEGAHKRARFENGVAPSEFKNGYKARLYRYSVIEQDSVYRVARFDDTLQAKLRQHTSGNPIVGISSETVPSGK